MPPIVGAMLIGAAARVAYKVARRLVSQLQPEQPVAPAQPREKHLATLHLDAETGLHKPTRG